MISQLQQVLSRTTLLPLLRRQGGAWLKEKREAAGLSQRDSPPGSALEYYTIISQIEAVAAGFLPSVTKLMPRLSGFRR